MSEMIISEESDDTEGETRTKTDFNQRISPIYKHFERSDVSSKLKCKYCVKMLVVSENFKITSNF